MQDNIYNQIYLSHICTLSQKNKNRYYDITESLQFAIEIKSKNKINYEFQNLCDFLDDTEFDAVDDVFNHWNSIINNCL